MTVEDVREIVLSLPEAVEGAHHGHPDFRIGKSIFGTLWPDKDRAVLRLPTSLAESTVAEDEETYRIVSNSRGMAWLAVQISRADVGEYRSLAEVAHSVMTEEKQAKKR